MNSHTREEPHGTSNAKNMIALLVVLMVATLALDTRTQSQIRKNKEITYIKHKLEWIKLKNMTIYEERLWKRMQQLQ